MCQNKCGIGLMQMHYTINITICVVVYCELNLDTPLSVRLVFITFIKLVHLKIFTLSFHHLVKVSQALYRNKQKICSGDLAITFNPILRGIKSNLCHAGGWGRHICPPMISREKKGFRPIPFAHPKSYQKQGYIPKSRSLSQKN